MKIIEHYSHLNGLESLLVHKPHLWEEIKTVIAGVDANVYKLKVSKEKTMAGNLLFSPTHLNKAFHEAFERADWKPQTTRYWVTDDVQLIRRTVNPPCQGPKG
jgi:hypothetical protein